MTINANRDKILASRRALFEAVPDIDRSSEAAEGGCGVLGLASNTFIAGKHVLSASRQMHNRGNGKGGGIAMVGLNPEQVGVDAETLKTHYILQIALLDPSVQSEVEEKFITPFFDVAVSYTLDHVADHSSIDELEIRPPDVARCIVRVKPDMLAQFAEEKDLAALDARKLEDEFVYQNTFNLNVEFYASLGEKRAFVLSHGRDLSIIKIVGYAEQAVEYYKLEEETARVWIAHQRYPTRGRVWHPGGAHPFIGMNEALVHNGDFANYHAVSEYLKQRNMKPLFLTDTEVGVLQFDLFDRVYKYPLEVTLEAMAPTTEHDFTMLSPEKQELYQAVQDAHLHSSPDGPWFFIVARSAADEGKAELLGITDTSMLRPQVFALYENLDPDEGDPVQIGLIASERQAIHACLRSLSSEDSRFRPTADKYWNARGGSYTDGGSFRFSFTPDEGLICKDKFAQSVTVSPNRDHYSPKDLDGDKAPDSFKKTWQDRVYTAFDDGGVSTHWRWLSTEIKDFSWDEVAYGIDWLGGFAEQGDQEWRFSLDTFSLMRDRVVDIGTKKRSSLLTLVDAGIVKLLDQTPPIGDDGASLSRIDWATRDSLRSPQDEESQLIFDVQGFPPEDDDCAARLIEKAYRLGWMRITAYNWHGGRFVGAGLGADTQGLRLDLYGDIGDYTASGLDGAELYIHADGQDQLAQIMRKGKLVIHGDAGQTFLYGAKGGDVYVRGSAAGRPLINAVGSPRVVINGTCLDYLAESFMAGDPHKGGGFAIVNGVAYDESGDLLDLPTPYAGGNLFSLASGGAIFIRDPHQTVSDGQLNGGEFADLNTEDWSLILPYLEENERHFGISVERLLTIDGERSDPAKVYRKVRVSMDNELLLETENR